MTPPRARAVVIGGGFAGLYAASYLARADLPDDRLSVQLISDRNYFTFTPLLAEVVGGSLGREDVTVPLRPYAHQQGFAFLQAQVEGVDFGASVVLTDRGPLPYDYLVLATGAAPRYFGNDELAQRSLPFTTVHDALAIREHVIRTAETAAQERDAARRKELLSFAVAGAGPAGVEVASEIWLLLRQILPRYYGVSDEPTITIFEGAPRILTGWDEGLADRGLGVLRDRGIEVHLETRVSSYDGRVVSASDAGDHDRSTEAGTLIWTAGTAPSAKYVKQDDFPSTPSGHATIDGFLCLTGHSNVFAAGDGASLHDSRTGRRFPPVAPIAISQGVRAAGNIENAIMGRPLEPYHAHHAGKIVSLGGGTALVDILGWQLSGRLAWATYRLAYLLKLVGTKNKLRAATSLALNHVFERDLACDC